jgi:hypothetical protein
MTRKALDDRENNWHAVTPRHLIQKKKINNTPSIIIYATLCSLTGYACNRRQKKFILSEISPVI